MKTVDPGGACLVDTNVILRWGAGQDAMCVAARGAVQRLERNGVTLYVAPQNMAEFWNTATRPSEANGFGLAPEDADSLLTQIEEHFLLAEDTPAVYPVWRRLVVEAGVRGVQVHDARLAAVMLVHGIRRILTFNVSDFARYEGIEALNPSEAH